MVVRETHSLCEEQAEERECAVFLGVTINFVWSVDPFLAPQQLHSFEVRCCAVGRRALHADPNPQQTQNQVMVE